MMKKSYSIIKSKSRIINAALRTDLRSSIKLERFLERKSISLKSKLVEDRGRTLIALALRNRQQEKDKTRGVGGALGIIGGGALGRRFFGLGKPRVPRSPAQLLRMQKGTSSLSRVSRAGRLGKLGRIGPLAVLGTGLDFAGRKAEGQTNLQAGIGAGGGLAGALAGAKYGAILGTALGGPVGTLIGGVGGSIIGGLAGGRLADLFTGAEKRRKFEEKRVELDTQRSLFSFALDDLDRVLDKLENISLLSIKGTRGDDEVPETPDFVGFFTRPKRFIDRPAVQITAYTLLLAGALVLGGPSGEESIPIAGLLNAMRQTRLGAFLIKRIPFLTKAFKKASKGQTFADELVPGVDIPGISPKGIRIRIGDDLFKRLFPNIKFKPKGSPRNLTKKQIEAKTLKDLLKQEKVLQEKLKKLTDSKTFDEAKRKAIQNLFEKLKEITKKLEGRKIPKKLAPGGVKSNFTRPGSTNNLKVEAPTNDNDFIALAPTNNIFLINQGDNNTTIPPMPEGGSTIVIGGGDSNPVDAAYKYAEITTLASTV